VKVSGICLTIGIIGLVVAAWPMVYVTYGPYATMIIIGLAVLLGGPFVFLQLYLLDYRHVQYFYMEKAKEAQKVNSSSKAGKSSISPTESHEERLKTHDPYDPTVAWNSFKVFAHISRMYASRDADFSGIVKVDEFGDAIKHEAGDEVENI